MRATVGWALGIGVIALSALAYWHVQGDKQSGSELEVLLPATHTESNRDTAKPADTRVEKNAVVNTVPATENDVTETVHGIEVRKGRNCTVQLKYIEKPDGTLTEAYSCVPNEPEEPDIYNTYTDQTLATLAYSDAHAAHVLSKRLHQSDPESALKLAIQSTAMSGDTSPINWLAQNYPQGTMRNDKVVLQTVEDRYVMSGVLKQLNDPNDGHDFWTGQARLYEKDGINIEALEQRVNMLVAEVERMKQKFGPD